MSSSTGTHLHDIDTIKVNIDNNIDQRFVRFCDVENAMIVTHIKTDPIMNEVVGVRVHDLLIYP